MALIYVCGVKHIVYDLIKNKPNPFFLSATTKLTLAVQGGDGAADKIYGCPGKTPAQHHQVNLQHASNARALRGVNLVT